MLSKLLRLTINCLRHLLFVKRMELARAPRPIRQAEMEDLPNIVAIYNSTIASGKVTADTQPVSLESRIPWFQRHNAKRPLFVVEEAGEIVGWLSFEDFYGRPAYSITAEISIYIRSDKRGIGIGDGLLRHAINQALQMDLKRLVAFIFAANQPSIKLFQKYGFVTWGQLPEVAEIDQQTHDLQILGLVL